MQRHVGQNQMDSAFGKRIITGPHLKRRLRQVELVHLMGDVDDLRVGQRLKNPSLEHGHVRVAQPPVA